MSSDATLSDAETVGWIVNDDALAAAFANTNFGSGDPRTILAGALLQTACGFSTGGTIRTIMEELALVGMPQNRHKVPALTRLGKAYLWAAMGRRSW